MIAEDSNVRWVATSADAFADTPDWTPFGSIDQRFAAMALRHPDRPAVEDLERRLTYHELAGEVRRIAEAMADAGQGGEGDGPVALLLPHDARFPIAFLGALAAGRCILPLDPEHPADRNRRIIAHAGATAAIATAELMGRAQELLAGRGPVLEVETCIARRPIRLPTPGPADPAYILYTSGSTGVPKGVLHSHANALNDARITTRTCRFTFEDSTCVFYAGTMGAVRHILSGLLNGAAVHVLPARRLGAAGLLQEMRTRRISLFQCVTTLFRRVAQAVPPGGRLDGVRMVRLIGDRSDWSDVDLFKRAFSDAAQLEIAIGSTECSSTYAHWIVDQAARADGGRLPVGRPTQGVEVAILGEDGAPVADGEVGEAVVTSSYLALGYWRDPELTAAAFKTDPSNPGVRILATGDLCRRRPDGLIEFIGRKDQLVKLRGHRLEPAEVEAMMRRCSGVADGAAVVRMAADGRARALAGHVELQAGVKGLLPRHILAMLSQKLPRHMTPSIIYIGPLPRLANFKLDRQALAARDAAYAGDVSTRSQDRLLDQVAMVFEAVVGCSGATGEDDLLSLGGDSLQAVEVMLELERRFHLHLPEKAFRDSRNIVELSAWIGRQTAAAAAAGS